MTRPLSPLARLENAPAEDVDDGSPFRGILVGLGAGAILYALAFTAWSALS